MSQKQIAAEAVRAYNLCLGYLYKLNIFCAR